MRGKKILKPMTKAACRAHKCHKLKKKSKIFIIFFLSNFDEFQKLNMFFFFLLLLSLVSRCLDVKQKPDEFLNIALSKMFEIKQSKKNIKLLHNLNPSKGVYSA